MVTSCWGRRWAVWLPPDDGEGGFYGDFPLGKMGFMVTPRWGRVWVYGYFLLGKSKHDKEKDRSKKWKKEEKIKRIKKRTKKKGKLELKEEKEKSWVLWYSPLGGEGGLLGYSPLGERVGCRVTSRWESWFYGCFPLGKLVSGLLPAGGEIGCMITPRWGS